MNTINEHNATTSDWVIQINDIVNEWGTFYTIDEINNPLTIEYEKVCANSSRLAEIIKELSPILIESYAQGELRFAHKHPELVAHEYFLKSLEPLFKDGLQKVDWSLAQEQMRSVFKNYFEVTDFAKFGSDNDIHVFVVAKDKETNHVIGLIQFLITPTWAYGEVKAAFYCIMPAAENRGIEKLLMSSIFKLIPQTKRIFMHTRSTNERAINEYCDWGFVITPSKLVNWTDLEYNAEQENALQYIANKKLK